ncbi:MAG: ribbon-helix-helix protein, CopG family [Methanophagales archaeon]|nr:ribbon-helix-helix protein, CopG family [Methanophagales archaeon]
MEREIYPIDITKRKDKLEKICKRMGISNAEAIRDAIDFYYDYVRGLKVIELRDVSKEQAEKEILEYVKEKGKAWTDEISDDLRIDIVLVNEILKELAEKGVVE